MARKGEKGKAKPRSTKKRRKWRLIGKGRMYEIKEEAEAAERWNRGKEEEIKGGGEETGGK